MAKALCTGPAALTAHVCSQTQRGPFSDFTLHGRSAYDLNLLGSAFPMLRFPSRELVFVMCGDVGSLHRHRYLSVWCSAERKCQQGAALSLPTAGFCLLVFSSVFCSFSFPFLKISIPVYTIAGIHQEVQFSSLPGTSLWRTLVMASPVS